MILLKEKFYFLLITAFISSIFINEGLAQSTRGLVNDGVDKYKSEKFADAEVNFRKGTEKTPESLEAVFNLGDAYYKQQKYDEAIKTFNSALANTKTDKERAKIHYNIGNSLLKSQKIKESIEEYKQSLKLNPDDPEAKYNLSYALNMLNNQNKNQQNKDQNNKDQNKDKNQDQNKDQQKQDQNKDQQKQDQQKQDQKNQEAQQDNTKQQQEQPKISKEEAQRILNALKNNEKELQKELRRIKGKRVTTEKDW